MPDIPPPVPPEIVRRAAETIRSQHWDGTGCGTHGTSACSRCYGPSPADAGEVAYDVLAAVYGDIVEAARRDALDEAIDAVDAADTERYEESRAFLVPYIAGLVAAARIVTDLRDATAPPSAPHQP